ncbi:MAG TPA: cyclic nucleotide-binding domain-containing protein [Acidimicrobiales bacterium]|nr:cyclic nucleotide-binding domain-containing protein [Acidimicrobiales bacterium]
MARRDYTEYLARVPLFSALTARELREVAKHSEHTQVAAGDVLTEEGTIGHEFYVVLEGRASVTRDGREINTLGPGDFFGELSLLDRAPRNATITATTPLDVVILGQREFNAALDTMPGLAHKLLVGLARRIHRTEAEAVATPA